MKTIKVVEYFGGNTRIKVIEYADGRKTYSPQQKFLWWWSTMTVSDYCGSSPITCGTMEEAQKWIDHVAVCARSTTKQNVTYINYP